MLSLLRSERKQKNLSNPFRIRTFLLLSYSFRIETINMLIHSHSSLENHARFQTKMDKVYTVLRPKRRKNPTRWGGTYRGGGGVMRHILKAHIVVIILWKWTWSSQLKKFRLERESNPYLCDWPILFQGSPDLETERERPLTKGKRAERTKRDFRCSICLSSIGQASCLICARRFQLTFPFCC